MGSFADFSKTMNGLASRVTPTVLRQAREAGLEPLVEAAQANLASNGSNKTGKLSISLGIGAGETPNESRAGPIKGKAHAQAAVLVEFGTAPHFQPNRGGGRIHPGASPKPFMRPAFEQTKDEMVQRAADSLAQSIFGKR